MVNDVIVRNVMQEEPSLPSEEVAVHRTSRATLERPLFLTEVWELRIGVVEICDHNEL